MAGQLPNLAQTASRFQKQAGQAVQQQVVNEAKAVVNTAAEQLGADEFLEFEEEPQEELRQGQIPSEHLESYKAEVKQKEQQALAALHARIEQMRGQRMQMEQAYHQRVDEQMQAATSRQEVPAEAVAPQSSRPAPNKNPEMAKKKH